MKKNILLLLPILFLLACEKKGELPLLPSYASFKLSSAASDKYYHVMAGDSTLIDSLSSRKDLSTFITTGEQRIRIKEEGAELFFIDTTIDIQRPGTEFTLLSLGDDAPPLFFAASSLQTTPPAAGSRKYSIMNTDKSVLMKDKKLNIKFYDLGADGFELLGELKNLEYKVASPFIELKDPAAGQYFLNIENSETGELIMAMDSYLASMGFYYEDNNVYLFKLANIGEGWDYVSGEKLIGVKL